MANRDDLLAQLTAGGQVPAFDLGGLADAVKQATEAIRPLADAAADAGKAMAQAAAASEHVDAQGFVKPRPKGSIPPPADYGPIEQMEAHEEALRRRPEYQGLGTQEFLARRRQEAAERERREKAEREAELARGFNENAASLQAAIDAPRREREERRAARERLRAEQAADRAAAKAAEEEARTYEKAASEEARADRQAAREQARRAKEEEGAEAERDRGEDAKMAGTRRAGAYVAAGATAAAAAGTVAAPQALAGGVQAFVGALTGPIAALRQVGSAVRSFVGALNPAPVMQFELAMRNLAAAFGVVLQPILDAATSIANELNAALTPAFTALRPVVQQVAQAFGAVASVWAGAFASILESLTPAFQLLADVASAFAPLFQAFYAGIAGLVSATAGAVRQLFAVFGIDTGDVVQGFKDAVRMLADGALLATAALLKFYDSVFGTNLGADFVKGATDALGGGERKKTVAAPTNPQTMGIADIGSVIARNAIIAGVGGQDRDAEDKAHKKALIGALKDIDKNFSAKADEIGDRIIGALGGKTYEKGASAFGGAAAGAAIGTAILPGIGTSIGGIIGAFRR